MDLKPETPEWRRLCSNVFEEEASDDMQTDRTIPVEDTDPDQMGTLDDILSDQMDTSDDDMQSDQIDSLARGDDDMEGGGRPPKRRNVEIGMTNLQIESCLKDYPTTVCCADELPAHVGARPRMFIVNTDTCNRGGNHWVAFHFPLVGPAEFFNSLGNAPEAYHRRFASVLDRQRTAILLLFVSNPTRRHRHLRTVLPVLLQMETSRNGAAGHSERLFHR